MIRKSMLTRKIKIVVCVLCGSILLACIIGICHMNHSTSMVSAVDIADEGCNTDGLKFYDANIDTMLLGRWQHCIDTTWYRVYTQEPAGEGYNWGREWDTSEDIYEEDLLPYGNGWFKWKKEEESVIELHMTDIKGASIPYEYKVLKLDPKQLQFKENFSTEKHLFRKI